MNLLQVYWLLQNTVESRDKSKDNLVLLYITEGLTVVNIRLIYKQNGNVSWQREGTRKVITMSSGAQFTTLSLLFDLRMLSSTDVLLRLLNQLIVWIRVQANMIHSIIDIIFSPQTCSK